LKASAKERAKEFLEGREGSVSMPLKLGAAAFGAIVLVSLIYRSYSNSKNIIDQVNQSAGNYTGSIGSP